MQICVVVAHGPKMFQMPHADFSEWRSESVRCVAAPGQTSQGSVCFTTDCPFTNRGKPLPTYKGLHSCIGIPRTPVPIFERSVWASYIQCAQQYIINVNKELYAKGVGPVAQEAITCLARIVQRYKPGTRNDGK